MRVILRSHGAKFCRLNGNLHCYRDAMLCKDDDINNVTMEDRERNTSMAKRAEKRHKEDQPKSMSKYLCDEMDQERQEKRYKTEKKKHSHPISFVV